MPTSRPREPTTGAGWRFPPCLPHRPLHLLMAWSTWVRPTTADRAVSPNFPKPSPTRSEEHTSELQSQSNLVCRLLLEKKKNDDSERHTAVQHDARHAPASPRP